jgi:predicted NBD/HSP70 family sugar kinase
MIAAIDIGGTKTLVVVFDDSAKIIEQQKFPTPKEYADFLKQLESIVVNLSTKEFASGALGIRGNIDREKGLSLMDDVLPWSTVPIRDDCQKIFNCPFAIENDSKLAGLSEAVLLKNKYRKVLYITISTGIGSAFVIDGELDKDTIDSEIGKGVYEHAGKIQQWEDFASGKAIVEEFHKMASELEDPAAWKEISENLATGILNAIAAYTPDVVVLGGGVGSHYDKFKNSLNQALGSIKPREIALPPILEAKRPEEAVIYGCFELARKL